jgi:DNA-binding phage protein
MRTQKTIAAVAMTAALAGGALIGTTLGNPLASGAQSGGSTTTTAPAGASGKGTTDPGKPGDGRGPRGGFDLEVAAKTLGITTEELRTQLEAGKSLADVAKAEGVDKQKLIDALVKAGEARLDEAKATLPDRVAKLVDATHKPGEHGPGGHGGPDGHGRGAGLEAAAKALGITEDALKTELKDGKTLAEVAKEKGVDKQKVIDALVAEAKARSAAAVKAGKITQAQADEHVKNATERITKMVDEGFPKGGRGGRGGPGGPGDHDGPPPADDNGGN